MSEKFKFVKQSKRAYQGNSIGNCISYEQTTGCAAVTRTHLIGSGIRYEWPIGCATLSELPCHASHIVFGELQFLVAQDVMDIVACYL